MCLFDLIMCFSQSIQFHLVLGGNNFVLNYHQLITDRQGVALRRCEFAMYFGYVSWKIQFSNDLGRLFVFEFY